MASGTEELVAAALVLDWELVDCAVVVLDAVVDVVDCDVVVEAVVVVGAVVVGEAVVDVEEAVVDELPSCALDGNDAAPTTRNSAVKTARRPAGRRR